MKQKRKRQDGVSALLSATPQGEQHVYLTRGVPSLETLPRSVSRSVARLLPCSVAQRLRCVPIGRAVRTLTVAMANPRDQEALTLLKQTTGLSIFPVACSEHNLDTLLETLWDD